MKLCKCGCGGTMPEHYKLTKDYIHGHNPPSTL